MIQRISLAWISMSDAMPCAPDDGWWIMMRLLGVAARLPCWPAVSRKLPMLAARPTQIVATWGWMYCMVS